MTDPMDVYYERGVQQGLLHWKQIDRSWHCEHPLYKSGVCTAWQKHIYAHMGMHAFGRIAILIVSALLRTLFKFSDLQMHEEKVPSTGRQPGII